MKMHPTRAGLPTPHRTAFPPRAGARRRGSIYAVVLGMAILVSLIGLSAIAVGRVNLGTVRLGSQGADADLLALSAVEHATTIVNTDANWRTNYVNGVETSPLALGRGNFTWKLVDEIDGSLSSGGAQPVRVWGIGRVGESRRCYSVQLIPSGPNLVTNGGAEGGLVPWEPWGSGTGLEQHSKATTALDPRSGTYYIAVKGRSNNLCGHQQDVTPNVVSGRSYFVELWLRMTNTVEQPRMSLVVQQAGFPDTVFTVTGQTVGTEWTKATGTITPSWSGTADRVYLRVETVLTNQEFHFDDVKLTESIASTPVIPALDTWRQEALP